MADKKISQLTNASTPLAGTEVLPIVQSSTTVKVATDDLTVKNVRSNATTGILQIAGPAAASTRTMTVPDANFTAARTDAANSFSSDQTLADGNLVVGTSGKGIVDTNGNESLLFTATASAVNELTVANAATGNRPTISATGGDTNIGINISPKGNGVVAVNTELVVGSSSAYAANSVTSGSGFLAVRRSSNTPVEIRRDVDDGILIDFQQDGVSEGNISVSGTAVSYNGGHLSRWAQTTDKSRPALLKGTVMSNLDQMASWEGEDNEQLNCMKVSDVEGDPNVAGVFVNWGGDTNDMNVGMTGDMIIRIAQGVTVQRGDLLMSAGDGTAKPQGDDIIRSKTIAKVTSNHVTYTYDDGSYCVPCVLMAC